MANFTPQQIEQFLQEFFDVVGARQYVGARYVPIFGRAGETTVEWDDLAPYEPLTVVMHEGVSYVSRRYVPTGIQITDTAYWAQTYRFNAQVEQYRQEVLSFQGQIDDANASVADLRTEMAQDYVPFPDPAHHPKYGTAGQVLGTLENGDTVWQDPVVPSDAQAEAVITTWLDDHPEATTTVQDGAVTDAKLAPAGVLSRVAGLASEIDAYLFTERLDLVRGYYNRDTGGIGSTTSTQWAMSRSFIPHDVILDSQTYKMYLLGYERDGTYRGTWNGTKFTGSSTSHAAYHYDVYQISNEYPTYDFKIDVYYDQAFDVDDAVSDIRVSDANRARLAQLLNGDNNLLIGCESGYFSDGGSITQSDAEKYTPNYIPVSEGQTFAIVTRLDVPRTPWSRTLFYGASKALMPRVVISTYTTMGDYNIGVHEIEVPQGAAYMRTCCRATADELAWLIDTSTYAGRVKQRESEIMARAESFSAMDALERCSPFFANVTPRRTRYVQHRGYTSHAPENSLPAFDLAGQAGCFGVELDLRRTSDNVYVVNHDLTIDAMYDGTGQINQMTYSEILQYHIDTGTNVDQFSPSELVMPTFEQVIQICKKYGMFMVIDEKTLGQYINGAISLLRKYQMQHSCYILANSTDMADRVLAIDPTIHMHLLSRPTDEMLTRYAGHANMGFDYNIANYATAADLETVAQKTWAAGFMNTTFDVANNTQKAMADAALIDFVTTDMDVI